MDSTIKRQQHTPKKEKTRSVTYRLPIKLVEEIETEAMNKISLTMSWQDRF